MDAITLVLVLLVAVIALVTVARKANIPYPILLVLGGLALGFAHLPGTPPGGVTLDPNLVFLLFLPPLLYQQSLTSSFRDIRADARAIGLLSIGLVLATTAIVAAVAHALIGLPWAAAVVLGAIVSPTDTVAAEAIIQRLRVPRRVATVLEGESIANDATALVVFGLALQAATGKSFSFWEGGLQFIWVSLGGVAIGLAVGWAIGVVRSHLSDPPVENTISLLTGFAAYLPAYALGVSGVLSVVATGLYLGRRGPHVVSARTRLQAQAIWDIVVLLLNGLLFILVGLQLNVILNARLDGAGHTGHTSRTFLSLYSWPTLLGWAALVSLTVIVVRMAWVFPDAYLPRLLSRRVRARDPYPGWRNVVVLGWTGMRGGDSLAAALAVKVAINAHAPGARELIIFLTFGVILATLVLQGLTLPLLIRRLGVTADNSAEREEAKARFKAAQAAMARNDALGPQDGVPPDIVEDMRLHYKDRSRRFAARYHGSDEDGALEGRAAAFRTLQSERLRAERRAIVALRDDGVINDEVMSRVQRDIDLEQVRLDG